VLEYSLELNELTGNPNDFRAQVVNVRSYSQEDIVDRIMRTGAGLTRSDIVSVIEAEKQVIAEIVGDGGAVNTELFSASFSIQGVFTAGTEEVDPHVVRLNLRPGKALRDAVEGMKTKKVPGSPPGPVIESVTDVKTGSVNDLLTPGRDLRIDGIKVKVVGDDHLVGLTFENLHSGAIYEVDPSDLVENTAGHVLAVIPLLGVGKYHLKLSTRFSGTNGRPLREPRTVVFDRVLTVEPAAKRSAAAKAAEAAAAEKARKAPARAKKAAPAEDGLDLRELVAEAETAGKAKKAPGRAKKAAPAEAEQPPAKARRAAAKAEEPAPKPKRAAPGGRGR